ncbi:MAG TPA: peptide deformylase [Clostridia bacterium]|nr:peptide deformylase [Clostridia bacterium]
MAIRNIRKDGDEILRKKCREVDAVTDKIRVLLKDMADTLYKADGVGLAAPQVGVLKRVVVIDAGDGLIELVNPVIVSQSGEQLVPEGCLSIPGVWGEVKRPASVAVEALNGNGEKFRIEGEGLLAQALSHEIDHLDGILFKDKVIRFLDKDELKRSE